jgi:hypothetical protein
MKYCKQCTLFGAAFISLLLASAVSTSAQSTTRDSLRGLTAVPVKVQVTEGTGTTPDRLVEFVELRLRRSGISVPETNLASADDGHAVLRVDVVTTDAQHGNRLIAVNLRLTQDAVLKRRPSVIVHVDTWEQSMSGGDEKNDEPTIRRWVTDLLDSFINDYLAVNRK